MFPADRATPRPSTAGQSERASQPLLPIFHLATMRPPWIIITAARLAELRFRCGFVPLKGWTFYPLVAPRSIYIRGQKGEVSADSVALNEIMGRSVRGPGGGWGTERLVSGVAASLPPTSRRVNPPRYQVKPPWLRGEGGRQIVDSPGAANLQILLCDYAKWSQLPIHHHQSATCDGDLRIIHHFPQSADGQRKHVYLCRRNLGESPVVCAWLVKKTGLPTLYDAQTKPREIF
ncbi:hypothetical protein J6590_052965 [Homalodisca vitripennis]|nr:hypothetical protein J6590_052965 [Homalodisca vitripennis]